ncbi:hypothetical protein QTI33_33285 [Variovorax sp. J22P271]|uniref:hypothetical protein n=1 Tax=Variovorax davisae TaxID=3053515 RepID=UPI0025771E2E|nr:hypothetical protein [Variovorax sp. J22P271]MDM0037049.1 hypothetical protein [Variovorax sp. J22P271]
MTVRSADEARRQVLSPAEQAEQCKSFLLVIGAFLTAILVMFGIFTIFAQANMHPEPKGPLGRYAMFQLENVRNVKALASVVVAGGDYDVQLIARETPSDFGALAGDSTFVLDFASGYSKGDPITADRYIFIGNIVVSVGDMANSDKLLAKAEEYKEPKYRSRVLRAHFLYANQQRGPPPGFSVTASPAKKTIEVYGAVKGLEFGKAKGDAQRSIALLELAPTEANLSEHATKHADWKRGRESRESARAAEHPDPGSEVPGSGKRIGKK